MRKYRRTTYEDRCQIYAFEQASLVHPLTNPDNVRRRTYSTHPIVQDNIRLVLPSDNSFRSCSARPARSREPHRGTRNARSHGVSLLPSFSLA